MEYKVIIFDCDGVLFDSNPLKTQAFREVLSDYPIAIVDNFIDYHKSNGGISRYVKFQIFIEVFLEKPFNKELYLDFLKSYSQSCLELYEKSDLSINCEESLKFLHQKYKIFVVSGSDQTELRQVFKNRNLSTYFSGIYGSPKVKPECIRAIIDNEGIKNSRQVLFIGDAKADMLAAQSTNVDFIFMEEYSDDPSFWYDSKPTKSVKKINNLTELFNFL